MSEQPSPEVVQRARAHMLREGARAAAWLVRRFRVKIRAVGYFVLESSPDAEVPMWIRWAMARFRTQGHWDVEEAKTAVGARYWTVRWKGVKRYDRRKRANLKLA